MIFAWDGLREQAGYDLSGARERLLDLLSNYCGFHPCELIVVFDSYRVRGGTGSRSRHNNLRVVYTQEDESADLYIETLVGKIGKLRRPRGDVRRAHPALRPAQRRAARLRRRAGARARADERRDRRRLAPPARGGPPRGRAGKARCAPSIQNQIPTRGGTDMKQITLGTTGITVPQNAFGALPIQRVSADETVRLLRRAREGGMRLRHGPRLYGQRGKARSCLRRAVDGLYVATKTATQDAPAPPPRSRRPPLLQQRHHLYSPPPPRSVLPSGDGTGMYEAMLEAKAQGKIRHIGITAHKIGVAEDIIGSGLYETLQYPFSYLSTPREAALAERPQSKHGSDRHEGAGRRSRHERRAAFAYIAQYDNVLPIWGIQRPEELEQWLGFFRTPASLTPELRSFIEKERGELTGEFCRGCGYCLPCPAGIQINQCARISLMIRRAPSESWLAPAMQAEMEKIEHCLGCGQCKSRCPYELDTPNLLKRNLADYRRILAGEVSTESYLRPAQK